MQESTSVVKTEWNIHMENTESDYLEDTSAVESGKKDMEEVLQNWYGFLCDDDALNTFFHGISFLL